MTFKDEVLATALAMAGYGWPVFPCHSGKKTPILEHGLKDASTDPDIIRLWWTWWPRANLAVATGAPAVDVVDIDCKAGVDGMAAVRQLEEAGLLEGALGRVRTPSGGEHRYHRGTRQGNGSIRHRGLDYRGLGGYVLVPPSIVDGRPYEVIEWRHGARGQAVNWQACRDLLDPPRPRGELQRGSGDVMALARWLARQPEGGRNNALYWASCRAVESGHESELDLLVDAARQAGLDEREARRTVQSAARRLGAA
jgi:hypothetical protein